MTRFVELVEDMVELPDEELGEDVARLEVVEELRAVVDELTDGELWDELLRLEVAIEALLEDVIDEELCEEVTRLEEVDEDSAELEELLVALDELAGVEDSMRLEELVPDEFGEEDD